MVTAVRFVGVILMLVLAAMIASAFIAAREDRSRLRATLDTQKQIIDAANARERASAQKLQDSVDEIETLKRDTKTPEQIVQSLTKYLPLPQPITLQRQLEPPTEPAARSEAASSMKTVGGAAAVSTAGLSDDVATKLPAAFSAEGSAESNSTDEARSKGTRDSNGNCVERNPQNLDAKSTLPCGAVRQNYASPDNDGSRRLGATPADATVPESDLTPLYNYVQNCRICDVQLEASKVSAADRQKKIAALTAERDAAVTASKGGRVWSRVKRNGFWFVLGLASGIAVAESRKK